MGKRHFSLFLGASLLSASASVWSLTLGESVKLAMGTNPLSKTLAVDVDAEKARVKQYEAGFFPVISLNFDGLASRLNF